MKRSSIGCFAIVCVCVLAQPLYAQIPNLESVARQTFESRPADVVLLRQLCDQTEALRAQYGEDDSRVQDGEQRVNAIKGMFTRRIAYAVHQIDPRFGLRHKEAGAHAVRPVDGMSLATDVLLWRDNGQVIDVMSDRNASWGMTPGDTQPREQWVDPLPEREDAPALPPAAPPPYIPPPQPPPTSGGLDYSHALQEILDAQRALADAQQQLLTLTTNIDVHVTNMDRTFTQTLGSVSMFFGKYIAPAIGGYLIAKQFENAPQPAPAK